MKLPHVVAIAVLLVLTTGCGTDDVAVDRPPAAGPPVVAVQAGDQGSTLGVVRLLDDAKGFGVIRADGSGSQDLTFSVTEVEGSLARGQRVSYEVTNGRKGPYAVDVAPAS